MTEGFRVWAEPQAHDEGPRRLGLCVYCKGLCKGNTVDCSTRVWREAAQIMWLAAEAHKRGGQ